MSFRDEVYVALERARDEGESLEEVVAVLVAVAGMVAAKNGVPLEDLETSCAIAYEVCDVAREPRRLARHE